MSWKMMPLRRWGFPLALSLSAVLAPLACRAQSDTAVALPAEVAEDDRFAQTFIMTLRCRGLEGVRQDLHSTLAQSPDLEQRFLELQWSFPPGDSPSIEATQLTVAKVFDRLLVESTHTVQGNGEPATVEMEMERANGRRYVLSVSVRRESDALRPFLRSGEAPSPPADWRPPVCR